MKRTIEISTRGTRLSLANARLKICHKDETLASIPVEDLEMVIVDSTGVSVSSGVLKALGTHGCALLACDDTHHPCGLFLPLAAHSLHSERVRLQSEASTPLKKNLWARIVRAKIANQAAMLGGHAAAPRLRGLADKVRSGDEGNLESTAARWYWPYVFESEPAVGAKPFQRYRTGPPPNNLLNYGYMVLRAATARAICAAGLQPALGIHHRNRYSGFCLADDLMEPHRPYVDRIVLGLIRDKVTEVTKEAKHRLLGVLTGSVLIRNEHVPMSIALQISASSLAACFEAQVKKGESAPRAAQRLLLPEGRPEWH